MNVYHRVAVSPRPRVSTDEGANTETIRLH